MPSPATCSGARSGKRLIRRLLAAGPALVLALGLVPGTPSGDAGRSLADLASPAVAASWAKRAKKKAKAAPPVLPQSAYDDALDQQKPAIEECVMELGIKRGVLSVKLDIKVLVNRHGQPFGMDLQVSQDGGDRGAMSDCVKQALGLARFPQSRSALTELHRQWTFSAQ